MSASIIMIYNEKTQILSIEKLYNIFSKPRYYSLQIKISTDLVLQITIEFIFKNIIFS